MESQLLIWMALSALIVALAMPDGGRPARRTR